ncbi:glutathione S-transferase domain-containing protein [Scheffersomyces amazonensis]|uniref:glutathione S-transferase domain-containing protein n=1 Tax=Scheffersomyces amazonensis TaxID=1078765 RepID=UPI00315D13E9
MSATINFDNAIPGKVTIYDFPPGPYPCRVQIALHEKKLHDLVDFEFVNLYKGEHKTDEFLRTKNYSGTLPVMEFADGSLLSECTAITEYIDNLDGNPILTGTTPFEKGQIHMMTRRVEFEFLEAISLYFHNATPGLGPTVEKYQNLEWGLRQRDRGIRGMHFLNSLLQKQPYIAGDKFSMADIACIGGFVFLSVVKLEPPKECKALLEWFDRVNERPSVQEFFKMANSFELPA